MTKSIAVLFISLFGFLFSSGATHASSFSGVTYQSVLQSKASYSALFQSAPSIGVVEYARERYFNYGNALTYCYSPQNVVGHWVKDVRGTDHCCSLRSPVAGLIPTHPVSEDGFSGICCQSDEFWDGRGNCAKAYAYPPVYQLPFLGDPMRR